MRALLFALLPILLVAAGCGGGEGDAEPTPQERLTEAVAGYERAVGDQDCRAFARYAHSSIRPPGKGVDDPPDAAECSNLGLSYTRLMGFKSRRTKVFGRAAIVEGTVEGRFLALIWTLDTDGRWTQVQAVPGIDPQIRLPRRPQDRFDENAAEFVEAQRAGDCRKVFRLLNPAAPFVTQAGGNAGAFCERFRQSAASPQRLAAQLKGAPGAKPVSMGGTQDLHFYGLDTGGGRRWTLILSTLPAELPPAGHVQDSVLDYYPNSSGGS